MKNKMYASAKPTSIYQGKRKNHLSVLEIYSVGYSYISLVRTDSLKLLPK
jgi:hypothetical protein